MGTFEASRPGGSRARAAEFFDQADTFGAGGNAGLPVSRAEALHEADRAGTERLLRQALAIANHGRGLADQLVRERATWLLDTLDDRF